MAGEEFYLGTDGRWHRRGWLDVFPGDAPIDPTTPAGARPLLQIASVSATAVPKAVVVDPTDPTPPVVSTATYIGACPDSAAKATDASVTSKYGAKASIRTFVPGGLASASRPATPLVHKSWKPTLGSPISDASVIAAAASSRAGDIFTILHESDVKLRNGSYTLAQFQTAVQMQSAFHNQVVRLRNAGSIPRVLTCCVIGGWTVDQNSQWTAAVPGSGATTCLAQADLLGIDMDGNPANANFLDYSTRQMGAKFQAAYAAGGYVGWTVPEFCMPSIPSSDPDDTKRVAWFKTEVAQIKLGVPSKNIPPPVAIQWFDTAGVVGDAERLTSQVSITGWRDLVATNPTP